MKKIRKGIKQPKANDKKKLVKKASESISHKVLSKDSMQGSSQMLMNSGKNLPRRKSERQLKFGVLDRDVKENTISSMCGKKPNQEGDDEEFDGKSDLIIDQWDCQKCKRWFHQICLVKVGIRRVGQKVQCIYCQSK